MSRNTTKTDRVIATLAAVIIIGANLATHMYQKIEINQWLAVQQQQINALNHSTKAMQESVALVIQMRYLGKKK